MLAARPQIIWSDQPSTTNWDPTAAAYWEADIQPRSKYVPLSTLLKGIRQGVFMSERDSGDIAVEVARVTDVQLIIPGMGERGVVSPSILRRHVVETGDVLVARVGRGGRACCIPAGAPPIVPREGLLVARPGRREWGPAIATALCTPTMKRWMSQLSAGGRTATLTKEQLGTLPVPSPACYDFGHIAALVEQAAALAHEGQALLEHVRDSVGLWLDDAPTAVLLNDHLWLPAPDVLQGWCWQDVQRYWLRDRAQWQVRGLKPLHEAIDLAWHRPKTIVGESVEFVLETDNMRSDWHLALPEPPQHQDDATTPEPTTSALQRFFAVDRECLLIPTVSNIVAAPLVVPAEVFSNTALPLMVPIHWLPLADLRYPRALAVVLDHPFVRLQRQLGGAFSTVPHITRDEIASLLIPVVAEAQWDAWEQELRQAHSLCIAAMAKVKQAIAMVEEWYA